mgnify:CR=1 FL=1
MRIRLDEKDFKALIAGEAIEKDGAKIILADIGYHRMLSLIESQMNAKFDKPDKKS